MRIRQATALWLVAFILPATADTRDIAKDRMARCDDIVVTRQYLDCMYAALQPLRAELGLAPAPQAPTYAPLFASTVAPRINPTSVSASQADPQKTTPMGLIDRIITGEEFMGGPKVAPDQFGLKNAKPGRGENIDQLVQPIASFVLNPDTHIFEITLANGQVWTQEGFDDARAHWNKKQALVATISYGASGTFNLSVGDNTLYKVRRIK
jgi:hypothetical protein